MTDYHHPIALLRVAVSILTNIGEDGEDRQPEPDELRAAAWRVADAALLLRAGMVADGITANAIGVEIPTGRGALLPVPLAPATAPSDDAIVAPGWALVDLDGKPMHRGATVETFRGEVVVLTGGMPPRHAASSGRVYLRDPRRDGESEFYPGVVNLRWVRA
jgi:hypothetical protein